MKMSDKERLENMSPTGFDLNGSVLLNSDDYHWLMERAEYVEELERDLNEWQNEALRLFKLLEEYQESHLKTKELNKRLREALEFYADENNYVVDISEVEFLEDIPYAKPPIVYERGIKARQALGVNENDR